MQLQVQDLEVVALLLEIGPRQRMLRQPVLGQVQAQGLVLDLEVQRRQRLGRARALQQRRQSQQGGQAARRAAQALGQGVQRVAVGLASMRADDRRQRLLALAAEAGEIGLATM